MTILLVAATYIFMGACLSVGFQLGRVLLDALQNLIQFLTGLYSQTAREFIQVHGS